MGRDVFRSTHTGKLTDIQFQRANKQLKRFKNAVMYYITVNRKTKKLPKLKDVLEKVIAQGRQKQKDRRDKLKNLSLDALVDEANYCTDDQFGQLKELMQKVKTD